MSKPQDIDYYINNSGYKKGYIAEMLGISRTSLHNKIAGKTDFKMSEANALCDLLNIPNESIRTVFFVPKR